MRPGPAEAEAIRQAVSGQMAPGDDIVIVGPVGGMGTLELLNTDHSGRLGGCFTAEFLENARKTCLAQYIAKDGELAGEIWSDALRKGAHALHYPGKAGFLGGLWMLAEASGTGLTLDLRKVPILQYTIEICEMAGEDPYKIPSEGSMLISMPSGESFAAGLCRKGILSAAAGQADATSQRLLYSGSGIRYLNKPPREQRLL